MTAVQTRPTGQDAHPPLVSLPSTGLNGKRAPWWEEMLRGGCPAPGGDWSVHRIPAGLRLHSGPGNAAHAAQAGRIVPDPERLTITVDAARADEPARRAVAVTLGILPPGSPRAVRLLLPIPDAKLAQGLAAGHGLDVVVPSGHVMTSADGLTAVYGFHERWPDAFWQWRRFRPGVEPLPCGAVYPSPPWEISLVGALPHLTGAVARRIPAGFALRPAGQPDLGFLRFAAYLHPSAEHLCLAVQATGQYPALLAAADELLAGLPRDAASRICLVWDGAAAGGRYSAASQIAQRHGIEVVAPDGEVRQHRLGPLIVTSPAGSGRWLRFRPGASPDDIGPAFPPNGNGPAPVPVLASGQAPTLVIPAPAAEPELPAPGFIRSAPTTPREPETPESSTPATHALLATLAGLPAAPSSGAPMTSGSPADSGQHPKEPGPAVLSISRDHRSSAAERQQHRELLGSRHDAHTVAVGRILAQRPALRGASAGAADAVAADLAALRAYLCGDLGEFDAALRGSTLSAAVAAQARCIVSGLRNLPSHRGIAYRNAELDPASFAQYRPGRVLTEPAFTSATVSPTDGESHTSGMTRYVIWSQTGKRTAALDTGTEVDEVVFVACSTFIVLDTASGTQQVVYLREQLRPTRADTTGSAEFTALGDADRQILERLRAAAEQVPAAGDEGLRAPATWPSDRDKARYEYPLGLAADGRWLR